MLRVPCVPRARCSLSGASLSRPNPAPLGPARGSAPGARRAALTAALLGLACQGGPASPDKAADSAEGGPADVSGPQPWSSRLTPSSTLFPSVRGAATRRLIVHLHSPWSHDACDGAGFEDGIFDEACLADLRRGLCDAGIDLAFVTDHPGHAGERPYSELMLSRAGDAPIEDGGAVIGNRLGCEDGRTVAWMPGIEDEMMPIGLRSHVSEDPAVNNDLYNRTDAEAFAAVVAAGAAPFVAHTEQRDIELLRQHQQDGLVGAELFNLHAAFDPDIRSEFLGLEKADWLARIAPMTSPAGTAEPDLFMLAVLIEQAVSVGRWDALQQTGETVGVAGTDAHQNVLPTLLRDGDRGDSYRRMLRWFSNQVRLPEGAQADDPLQQRAALLAGRSAVVFEILGSPIDWDLRVEGGSETLEMGSTAPFSSGMSLVVDCPRLAPTSPQGEAAPEVEAVLFKDGAEWARGCGTFAIDGPGVYRARFDVRPLHLRGFLGDDPEPWLGVYPWIYTNPVRLR